MTITTHTHKVISEKIEVEVIKTIFHWYSTYKWEHYDISPNSHCLLRIYFFNNETEAVVIASELYSNDGNTDVYHGYPDLVKAAIGAIPVLGTILPQVIWTSHSGQFTAPLSWAESHQQDCFRRLAIQIDSTRDEVNVTETGILRKEEIVSLLKGANLEPAVEVLRQLQHDNKWGRGVVDEQQVKGCLELEEGIIEGKKRMKGLVGW